MKFFIQELYSLRLSSLFLLFYLFFCYIFRPVKSVEGYNFFFKWKQVQNWKIWKYVSIVPKKIVIIFFGCISPNLYNISSLLYTEKMWKINFEEDIILEEFFPYFWGKWGKFWIFLEGFLEYRNCGKKSGSFQSQD